MIYKREFIVGVDVVGMAVLAFGGRSMFLLVVRMEEMEGMVGVWLLWLVPTWLIWA